MENVTSGHSHIEKPLYCQCLINLCHALGELHSMVQGTCFASFEKHGDIIGVGKNEVWMVGFTSRCL